MLLDINDIPDYLEMEKKAKTLDELMPLLIRFLNAEQDNDLYKKIIKIVEEYQNGIIH